MRRFMRGVVGALGVWGAAALHTSHAANITAVSPLGEVAQVRQVTVRFSEAVVPFGDLRRPDPMALACEGSTPAGSGRWLNDRVWVLEFRELLPPGTRCTLKTRADWKPLSGTLASAGPYAFNTGGPAVVATTPGAGSSVEEEALFLLQLSGPAVESSVAANAWCEAEGLGERLAARIVTGPSRDALLKARQLDTIAERVLVLGCQRPLPNDVRLSLVWGKGIAAAANPKVTTRVAQRFNFRVRKAFTAEFSCEREKANAACLPIRPMRLGFSEPISRALAEQVRLQATGGAALAPLFDKDDKAEEFSEVRFATPLPENTRFTISLPRDLKDAAGRTLANAARFPLQVATGDAPPLAKFSAAPFGVIELGDAVLPVTVRHVQGDLRPAAVTGQVRVKRLQTDADILAWYTRLRRWHETALPARELGLPESQAFTLELSKDTRGRTVTHRTERQVATREVSIFGNDSHNDSPSDSTAKRLDLPQLQGGDPRPFEVVGIPLAEPGYHVVEIASTRLGSSLLDKAAPMYVRTGVLVTNLGVHFKHGRENSLVWVTTLDRGRAVANAEVAVNDCHGKPLWAGRTNAHGLARVPRALDEPSGECAGDEGLFISARLANAKGIVDTAFVFSRWNKGIEPWRFNLPTAQGSEPEARAHTVFDRTLLRAGETVSMKHFLRLETAAGLAAPKTDVLPNQIKIVHEGSGQEFVQAIGWRGTRSATSSWPIPASAKLGLYQVVLEHTSDDARLQRSWDSGNFRVEEFRLPLVDARVSAPKVVPIAPSELAVAVQLNYFSGGPMAQAAARGSALLKARAPAFTGYDEFSFDPPREPAAAGEGEGDKPNDDAQLVADKLPLTTDKNGAAVLRVKDLPPIRRASELLAEVTFNDPNGEMQTAATRITLWPSAVVLGIQSGSWVSNRGKVKFTALALDTAGKPLTGQAIEVRGRVAQVITTRKRLVGGFYAYDNRTELKDLGALCRGTTDERGLLRCEAAFESAGQVDLIASAKDSAGHTAQAATSLWVTRQGEVWFAQDNDDRIDVLPEKKRYEPGETARLQVRMPFREATALVSVEREGIIDTRVVTLRGDDPTVELKIDKTWGPNVYVSVLALRGRIREVPWYSFFDWGWKEPLSWLRSFWYEGREYEAPTAMVDLSKPAFKLGVAALKVGTAAHELQVSVTSDKPQYTVRQTASARIKVTQGGKPVAGAEVAFAAVDEGLLALRNNDSWDLLAAMIRERAWGVETSTAQGDIIGKRHYGRKAVAAGGGGGHGGTRELFDTLLVWKAVLTLDANGEAGVEVPLNDSLTSFKLVAVADAGLQQFGSGATSIRVTQDLQVLAGLPPLVREGDRFAAMLTLRNTTAREMKVRATLAGGVNSNPNGNPDITRTPLNFAPQDVVLAAGAAQEVVWPVHVPADAFSIAWEATVEEQGAAAGQGAAKDRLKLMQLVSAAVPIRVMQATLVQLDGRYTLPVAAPADALAASGVARGGLKVGVQATLSGALPGMRRYFETYPFICLEQKTSKAVGLRDAKLWAAVSNALPTYLDSDGLASYFPPRSEDGPRGSDRLTAYVLAATHEASFELPAPVRDAMLAGLQRFVNGNIQREFWSPEFAKGRDLDVRKLAAIEALSRYGRATPKMLGSIKLTPNLWPTAAVIDWFNILKRLKAVPEQAKRLDETRQILRSRLTYAGTTLKFSTEDDDFWWWLMDSADANAARLILAVLDDPAWRDELPRMVVGSLARQRGGAWLTTTANLWGSLALDKFSAKFEAVKVAGRTVASAGGKPQTFDWRHQPEGGAAMLAWPVAAVASAATLNVAHEGAGKPWLSVQSLAAVPLKAPIRAGYSVVRSVSAVEQKDKSQWSRGDVLRVRLEVDAQSDMTWVVLSDPVPAGATLLGSGLGRDSAIATRTERNAGRAWAAYEERSFEAFRSYFEYLPRGKHVVEYTVRLNNPGRFGLPPTRVEAMYAPESFGESPNATLEVAP